MMVSEAHRKLVLNVTNPGRITSTIPTAQVFTYKGKELVAVPHRDSETRILRSMGIQAPAPITRYYNWPGQYKPFHAQQVTSAFLTQNKKAFVLNDMGTGKTLATLWAYDYLRSTGQANKALIISPLSTLERTWADEIFQHFPHLSVAVLHGSKSRRQKLLGGDFDIYLINHDGLKTIEAELIAKTEIDTVVVDEIASFRNASTGRWKSLRKVTANRDYLWGLTGTPIPNAPTDAWAQCKLISPERVPGYFGRFKEAVLRQVGPFKWEARGNATQIVADAMQPAIRFSRDQCVDLPPCQYITRAATLSPEQLKAFKEMQQKLTLEFSGSEATAVNEAVKIGKLVQIACGVVYGTDGQDVVLPSAGRLEVVKEIIEQAGSKVIIFVPYKGALRSVAAELSKEFTVETISGDTPAAQRADIFGRFQSTPDPRVLVAQPAAMSHGLTLTAASVVVWYAPPTSNEIYVQANARITRPGQKLNQLIVNISSTPLEAKMYGRLEKKQTLQGVLLDSI